MTTFLSRSLCQAAVLLALGASILAQTTYCLSVHAGPATGSNNLAAPSWLAASIGGGPIVSVAPTAGQTAAQASAAHEAAFVAAGYATARSGPNEFCVTAGPGGAPLTSGLSYGTDDTNLDIDSKVRKPPAVPGVPPAVGAKGNGVPVPVPPDNQPPMPLPGQITILVYLETDHGVIVITIQIQLPPGMNGQQLRQLIEQLLRAHGLLPTRARYPSPLPGGGLVDGLLLERAANGDKVVGIEYQYDAMARRLVHQIGGAGFLPTFGAGEYGPATRGQAPFEPWARVQGYPQIGSFFDVFHEIGLPLSPGGTVTGLAPAVMPIASGWLLVDPALSVFEFALTDPFGVIQKRYHVPPAPGLIGLPLYEQAGVVGPTGELSLTNAVRCVID